MDINLVLKNQFHEKFPIFTKQWIIHLFVKVGIPMIEEAGSFQTPWVKYVTKQVQRIGRKKIQTFTWPILQIYAVDIWHHSNLMTWWIMIIKTTLNNNAHNIKVTWISFCQIYHCKMLYNFQTLFPKINPKKFHELTVEGQGGIFKDFTKFSYENKLVGNNHHFLALSRKKSLSSSAKTAKWLMIRTENLFLTFGC